MVADFERATGPWHVEWIAVPESFGYAAGVLHQSAFMLGGLIVDPARMAQYSPPLTLKAGQSEWVSFGGPKFLDRFEIKPDTKKVTIGVRNRLTGR